jgi:hypothetical protein
VSSAKKYQTILEFTAKTMINMTLTRKKSLKAKSRLNYPAQRIVNKICLPLNFSNGTKTNQEAKELVDSLEVNVNEYLDGHDCKKLGSASTNWPVIKKWACHGEKSL